MRLVGSRHKEEGTRDATPVDSRHSGGNSSHSDGDRSLSEWFDPFVLKMTKRGDCPRVLLMGCNVAYHRTCSCSWKSAKGTIAASTDRHRRKSFRQGKEVCFDLVQPGQQYRRSDRGRTRHTGSKILFFPAKSGAIAVSRGDRHGYEPCLCPGCQGDDSIG